MAIDREIIWKGRNNTIDLLLKSNGSAQDLSGVTHIDVTFGSGTTVNSNASPALFSGVTSSTGQVTLKFGTISTLEPGQYNSELIVFDSSNQQGIVWGIIPIVVRG